jgi:hypothetical protein
MILAVLMMTLCLLCACGGKEKDPLQAPMDFRAELLARGGCAFELAARSEAGDRLWELELACALDPEGREEVCPIRVSVRGETQTAEAPCRIPDGVHALYFTFRGTGVLDFLSFELKT